MEIEDVIEYIQEHKSLMNLVRLKVVIDSRMIDLAYGKK